VSAGQWLALAVAALLVFWMVGAYNRLVALRNTIGEAVQLLHELLLRREAAVTHLAHALRVPLAAEQAALDTWLASLPALRLAAARQAFNDAAASYNEAARLFPMNDPAE
jgi:LemA protein